MLEAVPYYRLARDPENDRSYKHPSVRRVFTMGLRWNPPCREDETLAKGFTALAQLADGDEVSARRLGLATDYLREAIAYFTFSTEPEPYPGRNAEALIDLTDLFEAVS